jgi:hypothetical protein
LPDILSDDCLQPEGKGGIFAAALFMPKT